jgi:hypothetical protein
VSDVDQREAREVGKKAVQYAMQGAQDGSVTICRTDSYAASYKLTALTEVVGKTRTMPDEFISANDTDVTDAFRLYLRPLLGSGMPEAHRLGLNPVPKILNRADPEDTSLAQIRARCAPAKATPSWLCSVAETQKPVTFTPPEYARQELVRVPAR